MILYIKNPKESTPKNIRIDDLRKVARYKLNIQKSVVFLHTRNEPSENKIKRTIPFRIAPKRIIYFGKNLTKEMQGSYAENYKILKN